MRPGVPTPAQLTRMRAAPCASRAAATAASPARAVDHVALEGDAARLGRNLPGTVHVHVEHRHPRARLSECAGRLRPHPRAAARHQRRVSRYVHSVPSSATVKPLAAHESTALPK